MHKMPMHTDCREVIGWSSRLSAADGDRHPEKNYGV